MANTYTKIYIHLVLVVKGKAPLIPKVHKTTVGDNLTNTLVKGKNEVLEINCMPNHTHILFILHPTQNLERLIDDLKAVSKAFIQAESWMAFPFDWQVGFGAFSCSPSRVDVVANYVRQQEEHHRKKTFEEEYKELLATIQM